MISEDLDAAKVDGWGTGPTRVVRGAEAHAEVAALKRKSRRDVLIFGSHLLWNDLLGAGLVDEPHLMIGLGVVGEGVGAFESQPPGSQRLLDTRTSMARATPLLAGYAIER